jgi:hypothetical protein
MKSFNGRIRRCLPERDGLVRFVFEHDSGILLELRIKPRPPVLPRPEQRVIVRGELMKPAMILAEDLQLDLNFSDVNPKIHGD